MSADKRKVSTDALETLGTIIGPDEKRDAIHLAVEPAIAGEPMEAGQDVGLIDGVAYIGRGKKVGIVDPFLARRVFTGDRFWLVVYPRQITSLRHVWSHPDFPEEPIGGSPAAELPATDDQKKKSEAWLRDFAANHSCPDYNTLMNAATGQHELNCDDGYCYSRKYGEFLHFGGWDAHGSIPPEFWSHVEVVTGKKIPMDERAEYFSCSC